MIPRVILHNAVSLDGRRDWFKPDFGQYYALAAIWKEDATLVGSDTILSSAGTIPPERENGTQPLPPRLDDRRPLLVVPDSRGRIYTWRYWRRQPYWRNILVLVSNITPQSYLDYLAEQQIESLVVGDDHVDLRAALNILNERYRVEVIRVDSGGILNGLLLRAGLVDEVSVLVSPALVGGTTPRSIFNAPDLTSSQDVISVRLIQSQRLEGDTIWLCYKVATSP